MCPTSYLLTASRRPTKKKWFVRFFVGFFGGFFWGRGLNMGLFKEMDKLYNTKLIACKRWSRTGFFVFFNVTCERFEIVKSPEVTVGEAISLQ